MNHPSATIVVEKAAKIRQPKTTGNNLANLPGCKMRTIVLYFGHDKEFERAGGRVDKDDV